MYLKISFCFSVIFIVSFCSPTAPDSSKLIVRLDYLPVDYWKRLLDQVLGMLANSVCHTKPNAAEQVSQAHYGTVRTGFSTQHLLLAGINQSFQGLILRRSCHGWTKKGMVVCHLLLCDVRGGGWVTSQGKKEIFTVSLKEIWCEHNADLGCCRRLGFQTQIIDTLRSFHWLSFKLKPHMYKTAKW